jgi:uncharacterized protein (TIGR02001 family)
MKKTLIALSSTLLLAALPSLAQAQLAFNVGAVSDYRYRGITQSRLKPALQGGVDYAAGAFYVGAWASTIKWVKDAGGDAKVELDLYGGYKGEIAKDLAFDVGGLYYLYPSNDLGKVSGFASANTFELYGALTWRMLTAKYSHSTTNTFGFVDSKGSGYFDLSAAFDLGSGFTLTPHVGHQSIHRSSAASYTDYSLTVAKDLGNGLSLTAALVGTDADKAVYYTPAGKFTGKDSLVVGAKFSF